MSNTPPATGQLYDPMSMNVYQYVTQGLAEFSREDLFIGIPARVIGVDLYESQQVVDVEPVVNDIWIDGRKLSALPIRKVIVKLPDGGGFTIKMPIDVGDLVSLHYTHRTIDEWLDGDGKNVEQPVEYTATARDCYVTPGFATRKNNQSPSQKNLIIEGPETTITITPAGEVTLTTKGDVTATTEGKTTLNSTGDTTINTDAKAVINSGGDTEVNASGKVAINGTTIENNGSTFGVVTTGSINPLTGTPYPDGSTTLLNVDG